MESGQKTLAAKFLKPLLASNRLSIHKNFARVVFRYAWRQLLLPPTASEAALVSFCNHFMVESEDVKLIVVRSISVVFGC